MVDTSNPQAQAVGKGRRGFGGLQLRYRTWWVTYNYRGKRHRESSHSENRRDAIKLLRKRLAEIGQGKLVGPDAERLTYDDLKQMVLADYRIRGRKSILRVAKAFKQLDKFFGDYRALDMTADRVTVYIEKRQADDIKPATIQKELAALGRGFTLAFEAGKLASRPYIPSIEVRNVRAGFFEDAEIAELLERLPQYLTGLVEFLYLSGWQVGEALSLEWRQVDFQAGIVRLDPGTTKNDEGRTFPFSVLPRLEAVLRRQRELTTKAERRIGQIIPTVFHREGQPIQSFRGFWKRACKAAGVPNRLVHDLRRSAVRNLERASVPRSVAMKLTGHKTESVYRRYAIVNEADLREGVSKLAKLHEAQPSSRPIVRVLDRNRLAVKGKQGNGGMVRKEIRHG